jgi:chromosome segregation ATPase
VSSLIAAAEEHYQVLVSTITIQTQLLDAEKAKLAQEQKALKAALMGSASAAGTLDSAMTKLNKRLEADRIEMSMLADTKYELTESVENLQDENQDLDDQLEVDEESLSAKSDEIADLLSRNQDITEEKESLKALIAETQKKLAAKKYLERVAKRQERVVKASYQPAPETKYSNVRYTMAK